MQALGYNLRSDPKAIVFLVMRCVVLLRLE